MNKSLATILALATLVSCSNTDKDIHSSALFTPLQYEAQGEAYNPESQYRNPILPGFYPDPSICRVGDDYYMVNSSFQYFPAIPVWHSTDLVHWESCGSAIESDDKTGFRSELMQFGMFAPQISYNPGNGKFYIVCTQINGDLGCFFVTSDDPSSGQWSDPVLLPDVVGLDPSLFFDTDGRAYLTSAAGLDSIGEVPEYWGGNGICIWDFDWEKGATVGPLRVIARYGAHPEDKPSSLEGPHIYLVDGTYFLMCAEGGTEEAHSEVVFSSDNVNGPYIACRINPILTQRDLPDDRPNPVTCTGHADLVQTAAGNWYAVFLACQPYENIRQFNTGRQTFLLPVEWTEGQPVILKAGEPVPTVVDLSDELKGLVAKNTVEGFDGYNPGPLWSKDGLSPFALSIRGSVDSKTSFRKDDRMALECGEEPLDVLGKPTAVLERITGQSFKAETVMEFNPAVGSEAGLLCWHDDDHYMKLTKTLDSTGKPVLRLEERCASERDVPFTLLFGRLESSIIYSFDMPLEGEEADAPLALKVEAADPVTYVFSYAPLIKRKQLAFKQVGESRDGRHLSTLRCGGFEGAMVGVYAKKDGFTNLSPDAFSKEIAGAGISLVDVRTPEEYAEGHIPGAANVDWQGEDFAGKMKAAYPEDTPVAVYCRSGKRSAAASEKLFSMGYKKVYNLLGGYLAWTGAGKRVTKYEVESFRTRSGDSVDITLIKHGSLEISYKDISIQVDPVSGHEKPPDYATEFPKTSS